MGTSKDLKHYPRSFWELPRQLRAGEVELNGITYAEAVSFRVRFYAWRKLINADEGGGLSLEELSALNAAQVRIKPLDVLQPKGLQRLWIESVDLTPIMRLIEGRGTAPTAPEPEPEPPAVNPLDEPPSAVDDAIEDYLFGGRKTVESPDDEK